MSIVVDSTRRHVTTDEVAQARVVYFIASHVHPPQIERLVETCLSGSPASRVLLHHDHRVSTIDRERLTKSGRVDFLEPDTDEALWGAFGMCRMVSRCMRWLREERDFDWVVYLSGQDYPIQPIADIEAFLSKTEFDGFIDALPIEQRSWVLGQQRYAYQYMELPKFIGWRRLRASLKRRSDSAVRHGRTPRWIIPQEKDRGFRIGWKPRESPFSADFRCWMGASWWTLNRRALSEMLDSETRRPELARYYERVQFAPNESYFLTLLANNRSLNLCTNDNKRALNWSNAATGHPDTLRVADLGWLLDSGKHFARKFDARVDALVLDQIDERIAHAAPR